MTEPVSLHDALCQLGAQDARIEELESQLAKEKTRADSNFASYERVKSKYSDEVTAHKQTLCQLAKAQRGLEDALHRFNGLHAVATAPDTESKSFALMASAGRLAMLAALDVKGGASE